MELPGRASGEHYFDPIRFGFISADVAQTIAGVPTWEKIEEKGTYKRSRSSPRAWPKRA